jgi:ferritin-like metal-binding protein YciE
MPSTTISNPRDLVVQLLGELLYVERRLADAVLRELQQAVVDDELTAALAHHREQTKEHAERIEAAFRRLSVAPTSNLSRAFDSAVAQHDELAEAFKEPRLADLFHAQAALQTEHWEMAAYRTLLPLAPPEVAELLRPSFEEEGDAARKLVEAIDRLALSSLRSS